jgi:hypothetical protein
VAPDPNARWTSGPPRLARGRPWRDRFARWTGTACGALLAAASLGFLARDLLGLGQPAIAIAWLAGLALVIGTGRRRE